MLYLVLTGFFGVTTLAVLLAGRLLVQVAAVYRQPKPVAPPAGYPPSAWPLGFVAFAFQHNRCFGSLLLLGLIADVALGGQRAGRLGSGELSAHSHLYAKGPARELFEPYNHNTPDRSVADAHCVGSLKRKKVPAP